MSGWRDRVSQNGQGYFRGVLFYYNEVEDELGRRTVMKELPGRDQPDVEDLGRAPRKFTMELFVLGDDYDEQRDKLQDALETPGPGELFHPYRQLLIVQVVGAVKIKQSPKDGGRASFTVTFVEVQDAPPVIEVPSTGAAVLSAIDKVAAVAAAVAGAVEAAIELVNEVTSAVNAVRGKINAALQLVNDLKTAVDDFGAAVLAIAALPGQVVNALVNLYDSVVSTINDVADAVKTLEAFFGSDGTDAVPAAGSALLAATRVNLLSRAVQDLGTFGDDLIPLHEDTPAQIVAANARREFVRATKIAVACACSGAAANLTFDNLDQALELRGLLTDLVDSLLNDEHLPDELYGALADLRANVVRHLSSEADLLPELQDFTPTTTTPALVVAYQLYGDSTREAEILVRNPSLRDPTAIPGGQPIKVKVDA